MQKYDFDFVTWLKDLLFQSLLNEQKMFITL